MLTRVDVDDLQGHTLSLPLQLSSPGLQITEIEGLDPVKATIVSSAFAQIDGEQQQSARREKRNIVLRIRMEPFFGDRTVEDQRKQLYSYFMPKTWVNLKFYIDGSFFASIKGMVESFEAPLFVDDPMANISILCFDPNFLGDADVSVSGNTVGDGTEQLVTAQGSTETGYVFTLNVNRSISGFSLYNRRPDNTLSVITVTMALVAGDVVKISTVAKDKYAKLTRGGVTSSILYAVDTYSKWKPLYPGANYIRVLVAGTGIPYTIVYRPKYGGL